MSLSFWAGCPRFRYVLAATFLGNVGSTAVAQQYNPFRDGSKLAPVVQPAATDPIAAPNEDSPGSRRKPPANDLPPIISAEEAEREQVEQTTPSFGDTELTMPTVGPPTSAAIEFQANATPSSDAIYALPDDVKPSSFEGVTPGVSKMAELTTSLGEPKSRGKQDGATILEYQIGPFPKVQFLVIGEIVESIIVYMHEPLAASVIAKDLALTSFEPAPIPDDSGRIIGQAYPERGVLFAFATDTQEDKVSQIVLEPITSEPFVHRAEYDSRHRYTRNLRDLNFAIKTNPRDADAFWLRSRILAHLNDLKTSRDDIERAVKIEPAEPRYRLTYGRLLAETGDYERGLRETNAIAAMPDLPPLIRAQAQLQLGDLLARGPNHDYKQAIEHHVAAIDVLTKAGKANPEGLSRADKQVMLDAHLSAAYDVAAGNWRRKAEVAGTWLENGRMIADGIAKSDAGNVLAPFTHDCQALAAYDALGETMEIADVADRLVTRGRELLSAAEDPLYQQCLERELGEALAHAAQIAHRRGDQAEALNYAENAHVLLATQVEQNRATPRLRYLVGSLQFLIGANHAVFKEDHGEAIVWYEKALPLLDGSLPVEFSNQLGQHGERFVSMGVSYWVSGNKERGIELTRQGMSHMQRAVQTQSFDATTLAVPYNNLASMYRQLGDDESAQKYSDAMRGLKTARQPAADVVTE